MSSGPPMLVPWLEFNTCEPICWSIFGVEARSSPKSRPNSNAQSRSPLFSWLLSPSSNEERGWDRGSLSRLDINVDGPLRSLDGSKSRVR